MCMWTRSGLYCRRVRGYASPEKFLIFRPHRGGGGGNWITRRGKMPPVHPLIETPMCVV